MSDIEHPPESINNGDTIGSVNVGKCAYIPTVHRITPFYHGDERP